VAIERDYTAVIFITQAVAELILVHQVVLLAVQVFLVFLVRRTRNKDSSFIFASAWIVELLTEALCILLMLCTAGGPGVCRAQEARQAAEAPCSSEGGIRGVT
jgi:hypothetical protein